MAPVSRYTNPSLAAKSRAVVLFPEAAGPSMAMIGFFMQFPLWDHVFKDSSVVNNYFHQKPNICPETSAKYSPTSL
jgi:hypothetical protein